MRDSAAGIDVGSREHWVAVPAGRDERTVRKFGTCTADVRELCAWLLACKVKTVAMEATGVYWIALHAELERAGLDVHVANARAVKNVPGRKSDILDCQWLQRLHTYGLLPNSFRPTEEVRVLRGYMRQRENLQQASQQCVQHMQKALTEMNVRLTEVLSDIVGLSGRRILDAIVAGERDGATLAALADPRVKASPEKLRKSFEGDWREEHLFVLEQQYRLYSYLQRGMQECETRVEEHLRRMAPPQDPEKPEAAAQVEPTPVPCERQPDGPRAESVATLRRVTGADLTSLDGIDVRTSQVLLSEIGADMGAWPTEKHFASWLGLSPNHLVSGGKILKRRSRHVVNRASTALRRAAYALLRSKSALGAKYRRLRARLGSPKAVTALARHLACLVYRLLRYGADYVDKGVARYEANYRQQQLVRLRRQAAELDMQLVAKQACA